MSRTIDLSKKLDTDYIATATETFRKVDKQEFYKSPSGKMVHLAELLPNGDWWIIKSWRFATIVY